MGFLDRIRSGERTEEVIAPAGTEVLIGAPANPPPSELVARLSSRCAEHPDVAAAYLFQMMLVAEGETPSLALGLVLSHPIEEDRARELANDLANHAHPLRPEDDYLTIQILDEGSFPSVAASVEPFFERNP